MMEEMARFRCSASTSLNWGEGCFYFSFYSVQDCISSEDVTRAMRGQPKRLSRNYLRRSGGNVIVYVLISFHSRDVFYALSRLFVRPGFRLFCARLALHYLAVYSVKLNCLLSLTLTATATIAG